MFFYLTITNVTMGWRNTKNSLNYDYEERMKITRGTLYIGFTLKNFKWRLRVHSPSPFLKIMRTRSPSSSKFSNTRYSGRILESMNLHCSTLTKKDQVTENVKLVCQVYKSSKWEEEERVTSGNNLKRWGDFKTGLLNVSFLPYLHSHIQFI